MERLKELKKKKKRSLFCFVDLQFPVYKRARCHFLKFFKFSPVYIHFGLSFGFAVFSPPERMLPLLFWPRSALKSPS